MEIGGLNFLTADPTTTTQIGSAVCGTSSWISATAAACESSQGSGRALPLAIFLTDQSGTKAGHFTFDGNRRLLTRGHRHAHIDAHTDTHTRTHARAHDWARC